MVLLPWIIEFLRALLSMLLLYIIRVYMDANYGLERFSDYGIE